MKQWPNHVQTWAAFEAEHIMRIQVITLLVAPALMWVRVRAWLGAWMRSVGVGVGRCEGVSLKALDKVLVLELALCHKPFRHLLELGFCQLPRCHRVAQVRLCAWPWV